MFRDGLEDVESVRLRCLDIEGIVVGTLGEISSSSSSSKLEISSSSDSTGPSLKWTEPVSVDKLRTGLPSLYSNRLTVAESAATSSVVIMTLSKGFPPDSGMNRRTDMVADVFGKLHDYRCGERMESPRGM